MAITAGRPSAPAKPRRAFELAVFALSAVVAVGVAVLFLTLIGANRTGLVARQQSSESAPLIQTYRTDSPLRTTRRPTRLVDPGYDGLSLQKPPE